MYGKTKKQSNRKTRMVYLKNNIIYFQKPKKNAITLLL